MAEMEEQDARRDAERSSETIRQDIAEEKEVLSQTVGQISEQLNERLEWRWYVRRYPALALGAAAGIGFLMSGFFKRRMTPAERFMSAVSRTFDRAGKRSFARAGLQGAAKRLASEVVRRNVL